MTEKKRSRIVSKPTGDTLGAPVQAGTNVGPHHVEFALPSACFFYPWDHVYVRPFSLVDLNKINYAQTTGKLRALVEAVSRCLNVDAMELTPGDFNAVLYWLRANSYPSRPFTVPWTCPNPEHHKAVEDGVSDDADDEAKQNFERLSRTLEDRFTLTPGSREEGRRVNMASRELERPHFQAITQHQNTVKEQFGVLLYPMTMSDLVEQQELSEVMLRIEKRKAQGLKPSEVEDLLEDILEGSQDEYITELASHLNRIQCGQTLQQRIEFLIRTSEEHPEKFNDDFAKAVYDFQDISDHGMDETVTVKCRGCGHTATVSVDIDVSTFFP